jgi:hypothetical protein
MAPHDLELSKLKQNSACDRGDTRHWKHLQPCPANAARDAEWCDEGEGLQSRGPPDSDAGVVLQVAQVVQVRVQRRNGALYFKSPS